MALFADDPNAPFSLHRFVEHGASACGKHPGEWFGPSATARCIKALSEEYSDTGLNVYITGDGADVYTDSFLETATADDGTFIPTLILVGIRLGIDRVTPVYWEALKSSLQLSQSVGIAGYIVLGFGNSTLTSHQRPPFFVPLFCWPTRRSILLPGPSSHPSRLTLP